MRYETDKRTTLGAQNLPRPASYATYHAGVAGAASWRYLLLVILAAIAVLILPTTLSFLLAGFVLGMVVHDLQRYWHWAWLWPMYEKILAWDEIEALLADGQ